jgi:hypothetical protein
VQGSPGEYFGNLLYFAQPLKRHPPLLPGDVLLKILFKMVKKWEKERDDAGGTLTCRVRLVNIFGIVGILHHLWL